MPFIIQHEGRTWENDPDDPGNWVGKQLRGTKFGIDARSHPTVDIKNLTEEEATQIYYDDYWLPGHCEELPNGLAEAFMDASVNCGVGRANKFLKAAKGDPVKYNDERDDFYHRLVAARPRSKKYLRGWLNRTHDLRTYLHLV